MKTFWVILLVAFLLFIIINAIRHRHYSAAVYRARFLNRMRQRRPATSPQDAIVTLPAIVGATGGSHAPASTPDCPPGVGDASGACGTSIDGGGVGS